MTRPHRFATAWQHEHSITSVSAVQARVTPGALKERRSCTVIQSGVEFTSWPPGVLTISDAGAKVMMIYERVAIHLRLARLSSECASKGAKKRIVSECHPKHFCKKPCILGTPQSSRNRCGWKVSPPRTNQQRAIRSSHSQINKRDALPE